MSSTTLFLLLSATTCFDLRSPSGRVTVRVRKFHVHIGIPLCLQRYKMSVIIMSVKQIKYS